MKCFRIVAIFYIAVVLLLFSAVMPATPVQAARGITLSPAEGIVGARITITGTEFNKSTVTTDKYAAIYFSSDEASTIDDIDVEVIHYKLVKEGVWLDEDGGFKTTFRVPDILDDGIKEEDVTSGTYYVYVCHYSGTVVTTRIRAVATFTVTLGSISLSPLKAQVDTLVEVVGTNFAAGSTITFKYDESTIPVYSGNSKTSTSGDFTSVIAIPESTAGSHTISATVSDDKAEATIIVEPAISILPTSGEYNSTVVVSGMGFDKLETVKVWFYDIAVVTTTTDILGSFYVSFRVPGLKAGLYNVDIEQGVNIAKAKFTLTAPPPPPVPSPPPPEPELLASISVSDTTASVGQGIIVGGAGFKPNTNVTIKYDNEILSSVITDSNGVFSGAFTVPVSRYGNHALIASDGTSTSELDFKVESTPPPVPALLSPEMDGRVKSVLRFDWQDVSDDSLPVTYTLQVAISPDFSAASTVLDKAGLTETEYSVDEQESLGLAIEKKPYYWRVKATDSASNQGNWANTSIFYVVGGGMPAWAIITIVVLGVLFLLALGYFIYIKTSA